MSDTPRRLSVSMKLIEAILDVLRPLASANPRARVVSDGLYELIADENTRRRQKRERVSEEPPQNEILEQLETTALESFESVGLANDKAIPASRQFIAEFQKEFKGMAIYVSVKKKVNIDGIDEDT